jgi:hypothetical protein
MDKSLRPQNPAHPPTGRPLPCRRLGELLLVPPGSDLPPRCIHCNAPAQAPIRRRHFSWHSRWYFLLQPINLLISLVLRQQAAKKVSVSPGLCARHGAVHRRRFLLLLFPGFLLLIFGLLLSELADNPFGALAILLGTLLSMLVWPQASPLRVVAIEEQGAKFSGCKEPFLASLP